MKLLTFILIFFYSYTGNILAKLFDASEFQLENGLKIIVVENDRAPIVSQMIWYNVGSVDEEYGKSGLAHFLEHLMFKGTTKFPNGYFSKYISKNGGSENAFTSFDYTAYYQIIPSDKVEKIIELESDRMTNLTLTKKQVETEKKVILEERYQRIDSSPSAILDESMRKSLFPNHAYGIPIIGWEHEIKSLKPQDVKEFYEKYYTPSNATLIFSGDISLEKAKRLTKKYFGAISSKKHLIDRPILSDPVIKPSIRVNYDHPSVKQKIWKKSYKTESYIKSLKNGIALDIGIKILAGGSTSILYDEFVKKKKLVSSIGGYYMGMSREMATVNFYAIPNEDVSIDNLELEINNLMKKAINSEITEKQFMLQKKKYKYDALYLRDSIFQPAQIIGEAVTIGFKLNEIQKWNETLLGISLDDVKMELKKLLHNKSYVIGILG